MKIAYAVPETVLTNEMLCSEYGVWTPKKIYNLTGINRRRVLADDQTALDLAEMACKKLFSEFENVEAEIDFILYCTQSPDYVLPTTACILQDRLGLPTSCGALDYNLGCSGYIYGLAIAKALIVSNIAKTVLLVTAESYSKYINKMDRSARTIFGDAASATVVDKNIADSLTDFILGTDGSGKDNLIVPAGGMRNRLSRNSDLFDEYKDEGGNVRAKSDLYMNGTDIFGFTLETVPGLVFDILEKNSLSLEDIDMFIFHQANKHMLTSLRDEIGIDECKFYIDMEELGNTVSSTIPIAIKDATMKGLLKSGDKVVMVGFGVGYSWGACLLEFC